MKFRTSYINTLCIFLLMSVHSFAQNISEEVAQNNILSLLPPLQTIIDSAIINNPEIEFKDLQIEVNEYKLKSEKSFWMRNMGVQTDVRYGTFNNFSTNTSEGQSPSLIATSETQANYGVGLYVKFPFYDAVNRKNQVGLAKAEIKQAQSMAEAKRKEIRQMVINQYNNVVLTHRLFWSKSKSIETERINMKMVEEEFKNGVTPVVEFARIHQIVSMAEDDLERSRMEYINAVMILEEMAGFRFNIISKLDIIIPDENN